MFGTGRGELKLVWSLLSRRPNAKRPELDSGRLLYNYLSKKLVGMTGFEPAAPASRTQCATRLRYIPLKSASNAANVFITPFPIKSK